MGCSIKGDTRITDNPSHVYSVQHLSECGLELGDECCADSTRAPTSCDKTPCEFGLQCIGFAVEPPVDGTCGCDEFTMNYCNIVCDTYEQSDVGCQTCQCDGGISFFFCKNPSVTKNVC